MPSSAPLNPRRLLSRWLILAVMAAAALSLVGMLVALSYHLGMFGPLGHPWQFDGRAVAVHPIDPEKGAVLWAPGATHTGVDQIGVATNADLPGPRAMAAWGAAWPFLVIVLTCLTVLVLGACLLRERPFHRIGVLALGGLAVFDLVGAVLAPWLTATAQNDAIAALGLTGKPLAVDPDFGELKIEPAIVAWLFIDWTMLAFGVVCGLAAWLLWRAHGLQRDTEGLV